MSQKEDSNDVLSWLERRKKKQLQSRDKKLVPQMLNGVISPMNQSDKNESTYLTNSSGVLNNQVVLDDNFNKNHGDDDEAYGHTQLLSTTEVSSPTISNNLEPEPNSLVVTNAPPTKKAKFGLPGISPMPVKSKDNINLIANADTPNVNYKKAQTKPKFGIPSLTNSLQNYGFASRTFPDNRPNTSVRHDYTDSSKYKSSYSSITPSENSHSSTNSNKESTIIPNPPVFHTAHEKWDIDNQKRFGTNHRADVNRQAGVGNRCDSANSNLCNYSESISAKSYGANNTRSLGTPKACSSFKPPVDNQQQLEEKGGSLYAQTYSKPIVQTGSVEELPLGDERLRGIDSKMVELIQNEILFSGKPTEWNDVAGLKFVKKIVKEVVVFPLLRPDIFTGLRAPPKGILLFGPPGTGKTLLGKCIASKSNSTFFNISASSLTSKWIGDGEKMVRALFAVARVYQPSVVFIDEIDSLLSSRSDTEHESSRRLKTEFLVQLDGASTLGEERILVLGATNRPQDLDEAARRRLVKRLYVPLPDKSARIQIIDNLLRGQGHHCLTNDEISNIAHQTNGYSGADMAELCKESAMGPIRSLDYNQIESIDAENVRDITVQDFFDALKNVKSSVSEKDINMYLEWNATFGSGSVGP